VELFTYVIFALTLCTQQLKAHLLLKCMCNTAVLSKQIRLLHHHLWDTPLSNHTHV